MYIFFKYILRLIGKLRTSKLELLSNQYRFFKLCIFSLLFFSWNLESVEVKVLLQKYRQADCAFNNKTYFEQNPLDLHSAHGFVVSDHPALAIGHFCHDKEMLISFMNKNIFINKQEIKTPCYIFPMLSAKHKEQLFHFVQDWFNDQNDFVQEKTKELHKFFDGFVNKKDIVRTDSSLDLHNFIHDIIMNFLSNFMAQLGNTDPVVSLQTLQQYVDYFLQEDSNELLLDQLSSLKISKKDKKLLLEDVSFRYKFFSKQIHLLTTALLKSFIVILPRHFIAQILHDQVDCLSWGDNSYLGSFVFLQESNMIYFINSLDIDDYLFSVIRYEGWPGWPLEMNKVLAITCRTYLVWQMLQAQKSKRPYHIENGIRHQSYKGHHKYIRLKQAIEETRDVCIGFENKPILAMFDSCCGGVLPALVDNPDYKKHPYLLRINSCSFCKDFKIAHWKATFTHDQMAEVLKKAFPELVKIDSMFVSKKDAAGLVKDVSIITIPSDSQLSSPVVLHAMRKKMYSMFPEIKSYCFDIETLPKIMPVKHKPKHQKNKKPVAQDNLNIEKQFVISGKGQGHHMGLCQWGAMKLVRDYHWSYQKVLQFYYPGTNLILLTYQR